MVDTNDKGTENNKDEEMLEAFSLSSKGLETPAAGVGLKHLLPTIADGSCAKLALLPPIFELKIILEEP